MNKLPFYFLLIFSFQAFAQKLEGGLGVGVCHYKGDLMPSFKPFVARPGGNVFIRYNLSRSLSLKANAVAGFLFGNDKLVNDPFLQARAFKFNANFTEFGGQVEYNFLNFRTNASRIVNNWTPYVLGGYASALLNTTTKFPDPSDLSGISSRSNIQTGFNTLLLGVGFKKKFRNNWNWGVEFGTRFTNSDTIDNFGYTTDSDGNPSLVNFSSAISPKFDIPNTKTKDLYYYTNISISYVFYKVYCPNPK